ncbi:MAG TPA: hypothetical protein PKC79_10255 [Solidesulfovibrio magneticus]|nr:hypothetical protein [Solidesulfovibrio magneticus]
MEELSLAVVGAALGLGIVLAAALGFILARRAEKNGGAGVFRAAFLAFFAVYALGFAARYVLVEALPAGF